MFRQKYFCVILIVMMFFVVASGGCGGGSSNRSSRSNQSNPNTPNNPNNPDPNDPNPDNPSPDNPSPDNPETKYDFTILEGTWKASNCTGTAISRDLNAPMSLSATHNTITFTNVSVSGNTGTFEGTSDIVLIIEGYAEWEDEFGGTKASNIGGKEYQNTSGNTWRMERLNHNDKPVGVTITFTSETTAEVEQYVGTDDAIVEYSYTLTKQSSETPNITNINGTWRITDGILTYQDNGTTHTLNYVPGSSSPEEFTLTISEYRRRRVLN